MMVNSTKNIKRRIQLLEQAADNDKLKLAAQFFLTKKKLASGKTLVITFLGSLALGYLFPRHASKIHNLAPKAVKKGSHTIIQPLSQILSLLSTISTFKKLWEKYKSTQSTPEH